MRRNRYYIGKCRCCGNVIVKNLAIDNESCKCEVCNGVNMESIDHVEILRRSNGEVVLQSTYEIGDPRNDFEEFIRLKKYYNRLLGSVKGVYYLIKDGMVEFSSDFNTSILMASPEDAMLDELESIRIIHDGWNGNAIQEFLKPLENRIKIQYYVQRV